MTRKDYELVQTALGDALGQIQAIKNERWNVPAAAFAYSESAFWYTVECLSDYLQANNKNFNQEQFKDEILRISGIGASK